MKKTVRVRARDGLNIPLPSGVAIDSGITVLTPETPVEVLHDRFTRRRLQERDFVLVEEEHEPEPGRRADRREPVKTRKE